MKEKQILALLQEDTTSVLLGLIWLLLVMSLN